MIDDASDLRVALERGAGCQEAFCRLYDRHCAVVLALCRRHAGPGPARADAEDAMQETFIRAYRMLEKCRGPSHFRPWLYGIARRVCSERRRAARRRRAHEHGPHMNGVSMARSDSEPDPHAAADRSEALARLGSALDRLPEDQRLAVHLYYLDPDPVAAAMTALDISRSGFYKLLNRARARLATELSAPTEARA